MLKSDSLQRRLKARPQVELLEARCLLSNVIVNDPARDAGQTQITQSETSIVLANNGNVVVAYNDSRANLDGSHFTGFSRSTDGGATFIGGGELGSSTAGDAGDPALAINKATGSIYMTTLGLNSGNVIQLFRSTDNGASFQFLANAAPGFSGNRSLDKSWLTIDNNAGFGNGGIYVTYTDFPALFGTTNLQFNRSTNGGTTWTRTKLAQGTVQGSNVVVGADHSVYVFWLDGNQATERILMRKGTARGFAASRLVNSLTTTGTNGDLGLDFRSNAFPQAAVSPTNANTIYLVYADKGPTGDRADVYFTQSNNGGTTWSARVKLNDDTTTADQWQPAIAVTPDGSKVFVTWYDRRNSGDVNGNIERFATIGTVSGTTVTFGSNFNYSDVPFPEVFGQDPVVNASYMGDYDQATADNSFFYTSFNDNRNGNQDVFFQKVSVAGPTAPSQKPWLVVHGTSTFVVDDFVADGAVSTAAILAPVTSGLPSFANLGSFVISSKTTGGTNAAPALGKKSGLPAAGVDMVFAGKSGQDQFQGDHHAVKPSTNGDLEFSFATL